MMVRRIVDLTYPIRAGMLKYPTDSEVEVVTRRAKFERTFELCYDGGGNTCGAGASSIICEGGNQRINFTNHTGTHIDAPRHKDPRGKAIDDYPISKFDNTAVMLDFTPLKIVEREHRCIFRQDIRNILTPDLEKKCKMVGSIILYTGFCNELAAYNGKVWGDKKKEFESSFIYMLPEAAGYITKELCSDKLNIVGIDSFSVDRMHDTSSMSHYWLFEKDVLPLEGLVNLNELGFYAKNNLFRLVCVPLRYKNSDAAQTRAYAVVD